MYIKNGKNQPIQCRGLLDTCSTTNFMTENLAKKLNLKRNKCQVPIGALNSMTTYSKEMITTTISSNNSNLHKTLTFLIIPEIASNIPDQPIQRELIKIPSNIQLADPEFHVPAPVDILLGAGPTLSLLSIGQIQVSLPNKQDLFIQKTLLGWIIGGSPPSTHLKSRHACHVTTPVEFDLSRFWAIEECPQEIKSTQEESQCEEHFKKHVRRTPDGRYEVALPFNNQINELGASYDNALRRYINNEKRLEKNPTFKKQYDDVLKEYLQLNHMKLII